MKYLISLFSIALAISANAFSIAEDVPPIFVHKYEKKQANTFYIKVGFGESFVLEDAHLDRLNGKIFQVDLVYTAFKREASFNQIELNTKRIETLMKLVPAIHTDDPEWEIYEQTGATSYEEAESYFHGFVIHYGNNLDYEYQKNFFKPIQKEFSTIDIDNREGGKVGYYTGSSIEMEKYAVAYKNGKQVEGVYQLHYREFRNQAEIALSGIPMVFSKQDEQIFNSVGMYELQATKDGEELILTKDAVINFKCTEELEDVGFYKMDAEGKWTLEHEVEFERLDNGSSLDEDVFQYGGPFVELASGDWGLGGQGQISIQKYNNRQDIENGAYQGYSRLVLSASVDYDMVIAELNEVAKQSYELQKMEGNELLQSLTVKYERNRVYGILIPQAEANAVIELILMDSLSNLLIDQVDKVIVYKNKVDFTSSGLRRLSNDYTVPLSTGLVSGLRSSSFGVYNCDQTTRIEEPLALSPKYFNKQTGESLNDLYVTCVIDLNLNASLSYHPNSIVANKEGNNKLLLFSMDNRIYFLDKEEFQNANLEAKPLDLHMTEITDMVKTSEDLKGILDI